jgi:hypothetical protein
MPSHRLIKYTDGNGTAVWVIQELKRFLFWTWYADMETPWSDGGSDYYNCIPEKYTNFMYGGKHIFKGEKEAIEAFDEFLNNIEREKKSKQLSITVVK